MIKFIPPYLGEEIKSNAEKKMYAVLQELQLKHAYVLHSLGLPKHQSKIYGEIDFVVVCERGVACLEIKGGRVECQDGKWYFTNRYDVRQEKTEGPFAQVIGNMFSIRNVLWEKFQKHPYIKRTLIASGVVFPDIAFTARTQETISEMIYDKRTKNITAYINQVFDYWEGRQHREPRKLSPADIEAIVAYLRGNFCFVPALNDRLDNVERRLLRLTADQAQIMDELAVNQHLMIEGAAGTGKTLLAVDFARKQAEDGKKVLYLTFNRNLVNHMEQQMRKRENLKMINIHALFREYIPIDNAVLKADPQKYFSEILPEKFCDHCGQLSDKELRQIQYDLLIIDEGQDILRPIYLYALDYLLKGGLADGRWAVFYDEKQNIYNPEYKEGMELLNSYIGTRFRLFVNCRNTIQIGTYSSKESGVEIQEFLKENGEEVQHLTYTDTEDFKKQIKEVLKRLRQGEVAMEDVAFIAPNRYENSILARAEIPVKQLGSQVGEKKDLPIYSTIQGFKGLDSKVVILFGMDRLPLKSYAQYIYIAGTRARVLLYILEREKTK